MSDSDSKNSNINSLSSYFVTDNSRESDILSTDELSNKTYDYNKNRLFICSYNYNNSDTIILISNSTELNIYAKKYSELLEKNIENVNYIWGNVKVYVPLYGQLPLKVYDLDLGKKLSKKKKQKRYNKIKQKHSSGSNTSDSEQSNIKYSLFKSLPKYRYLKNLETSLNSNKKVEVCNIKNDLIRSENIPQITITHSKQKIKSEISNEKTSIKKIDDGKQKSKKKKRKDIQQLIDTNMNVKDTNKNSNLNEIEEANISSDNLDLLNDDLPIFISQLIKRKTKNKTKLTKCVSNKKKKNSKKDDNHEFILNCKKKENMSLLYKNNICGKKIANAIKMILENNLRKGIEYLNEVLSYNSTDHRNYLNRCYCYLRMKINDLALQDALYVLQMSTDNLHLYLANLRAGQASFALQKYHEAEIYLKQATCINPRSYHAQRELMRVKITNLVCMGFQEKDAILSLQLHSSTMAEIEYLLENNTSSNKFKFNDSIILDDNYDDVIYSSEEDEKPNNIEILNGILNYKPGEIKLYHVLSNSTIANPLTSTINDTNNLLKNAVKVKTQISDKYVKAKFKENAIWVGGLTNSMTEMVLKQKFKKFGNILSVYRPFKKSYAFVNFERNEDVINILKNPSFHEICGIKLHIRYAIQHK